MKRMNRARSSSLFLMELILAILFFSVASAVCIQFFIKSHVLSSDSRALTHAVNECAGIAEMIDTADDMPDCLALLKSEYPEGTFPDSASASEASDVSDAGLCFYYDDNFSPCAKADSSYALTLHLSQAGQTMTAQMHFTEASGESIYQLETKYHIARRVSDETR